MKCPKCGAENIAGAEFCNLCLAPFSGKSKRSKADKKQVTVEKKAVEKAKAEVAVIKEVNPWKKINLQKMLLTPVIAALGALILTLWIPKGKPVLLTTRPTLFIILIALSGGFVVASNYKPFSTARIIAGFLIGLSSVFIGYILTFLFWIALMQTNLSSFTKYSFGSETLFLPVLLAVGIALFEQIDKFNYKQFSLLLAASLVGGFIAIIFSKVFPFIHSFVLVGLFCWLAVNIVKLFFPAEGQSPSL